MSLATQFVAGDDLHLGVCHQCDSIQAVFQASRIRWALSDGKRVRRGHGAARVRCLVQSVLPHRFARGVRFHGANPRIRLGMGERWTVEPEGGAGSCRLHGIHGAMRGSHPDRELHHSRADSKSPRSSPRRSRASTPSPVAALSSGLEWAAPAGPIAAPTGQRALTRGSAAPDATNTSK